MENKKIFISGSIEIKELNQEIKNSLDKIIENNYEVLVGDANGIDKLIQGYFNEKKYFENIKVFHIYEKCRNSLSNQFKTELVEYKKLEEYLRKNENEKKKIEHSERKKQTFKDIKMAKEADFFFIIWDKKSEGTKNNILNGIRYNKKIKLFIGNDLVKKENINEENIINWYEESNGIGIKELKKRLDENLGEDNIPSQELLKKNEEIKEIYPKSSKTFLKNQPDLLKKFIVKKQYRGKDIIKYNPSILDELVSKNFKFKNKMEENQLTLQS